MNLPLVRLRDLTKRYDAEGAGTASTVLRGVDLDVEAGDSLAIVGPSGSGKSTLLAIMGALLPPTTGKALLDGEDLAGLTPDGLAAVRSRKIGFVFQAHHLLPQCTALENVLVPALAVKDPAHRRDARTRARELLIAVGLGDRLENAPSRLSGGECQRVAVARALINRPRLLLADEPTGSLDAEASEQLGEVLCRLNREESVALVVVTHSERLAARMARVLRLSEGRLAAASAGDGR